MSFKPWLCPSGRSRQHHGLAMAMVKLWESSSVAKIALKRGGINIWILRMLTNTQVSNPACYGIWLRYQSRTGYHNIYKEYRDTTLNGGVEQMYNEMASRHRVRSPCIQIIKTATIPQFHKKDIKFPLVFQKVRPPTRRLKTTYKATRPNLFK
ncbi:hypothetical protein MKW94_027034 [Papaver nudicaule]|uniref:Large ribosomal subunit protein eL20 domain-containing protein n=1 Tax=Papaver nudicaule TaxID=74823 RepID=A0AA42AVM4_PAPNU|nr:hypothetical protein [Papaver nudicaule]